MRRALEALTLAACLAPLAACDSGDELETVPIEPQAAALSAGENARAHVAALIALSADLRAAAFLPDGSLDPDVEQALDVDPDAADELAKAIEALLDEAPIESQTDKVVVYRLDPQAVCGDDPESAECVEVLTQVPLRIRATAPAEGDVDLELLVGEPRENPLDLQLHRDRLAVVIDLGAATDAAQLLAEAAGEGPLPFEASGVIIAAADRASAQDYTLGVTVDHPLRLVGDVEGEVLDVSVKPGSIAARLLGGAAPSVALELALGAVEAQVPGALFGGDTECFSDPEGATVCEREPGPEGTLGARLPALSGTIALTRADTLEVTDLGLADPFEVTFDGAPLLTFDPNPSRNGIDVVFEAGDEALDLRFAHAVSALASLHGDTLQKIEPEAAPGTREMALHLTGAAPHLRLAEAAVEVVAGALRLELPDGEVVEAQAGMCVAEEGEDDPKLVVAACG